MQGKKIMDDLPVPVFICDKDGHVTYYNKLAEKLCNKPLSIGDLWYPALKVLKRTGEPLSLTDSAAAHAMATRTPVTDDEVIIVQKNGEKTIFRWYSAPEFDENNLITGAINTLIDITGEINQEEKQAILAAIIDASDDAIISKTLQGIITSWNESAKRMFGFTEAEAIGQHISIIIPDNRLYEENEIISNITAGKKIDHFETVRRTKEGKKIPISLSVSPIRSNSGIITGASKIVRDISERQNFDEKNAILTAIVNTSDDAIISKTLEGIITSWNKSAERMFGYTENEVIGKHISLLIPPSRIQEEDVIISDIVKGNKIDHFETVRIAKNGQEIPISLSISPVKNSKGKVIGASKIARDISIRIKAAKESKSYTKNLELINSIGKAISEDLDQEHILQKVTDATTALTGAKFGAFFYNTINPEGESYMLYTLSGAPKEAFEEFGMPRNTAIFHPIFSGEGVMRIDDVTKDPRYGHNPPHHGMPKGHLPVVSYLAVPVISNSGTVIGGLFFGHPEAARFTRAHESIILAIAAQAAIGLDNAKLYQEVKELNLKKDEFIGLASHELKTPLTSISAYLQILNRMDLGENGKKFLSRTIHQVNKLTALVNDLLDVSKIEAGKLQLLKESFDFRSAVEDSIELIQLSNTSHNIIFKAPGLETIKVFGDKQRIEQVIINLLTNAVKYSPAGGEIEVVLLTEDGNVKIGVKDQGIGIPEDKINQIFNRFYRVDGLKPDMSGLGIGLYLASDIIKRHDGLLWAESELGKGSTFWFTIPI